jgi:hypothetical protein
VEEVEVFEEILKTGDNLSKKYDFIENFKKHLQEFHSNRSPKFYSQPKIPKNPEFKDQIAPNFFVSAEKF